MDKNYETIGRHLSGERVLLLGGAGFIGHHLAVELAQKGVEVVVLDNLSVNNLVDNSFSGQLDPLRRVLYRSFLDERLTMLRDAGVRLVNVDALLPLALLEAIEDVRPTKIVHLSAIASAVTARSNPGLMFDLQLATLRNVLEIMRNRSWINQIVLISSSTVYGDFEGASVDETTRPRPRGIYANAKYMAERLLRTYRHSYNLGTTIVRPSALYGERCISQRVSQLFVENALSGRPLRLEGGGDGRLDFTHVSDLVQGLVRALAFHKGPDDSSTFNLTYGDARTIRDLAEMVKEVVPAVEFQEVPRPNEKPIRGTLSIDRARSVLGFEPQMDLTTGYRAFCKWYKERWAEAEARSSR